MVVLGISWLRSPRRTTLFAALGLGLGLVLFAFGAPVIGRLISSFDVSEGSNLGRFEIWRDALEKFAVQPLGVGLGNYAVSAVNDVGLRNPITAHNLYLDLLVETGIFGFAAFVVLLILTLYKLLHKHVESGGAVFLGIFGALVGFSTHAFFENPLYAPAIFVLFLLGIAVSSTTLTTA